MEIRQEKDLPSLGATLFTVLLPIVLMLIKTAAELNMEKALRFILHYNLLVTRLRNVYCFCCLLYFRYSP